MKEKKYAPVAQLIEQQTFNLWVGSLSLPGRTNTFHFIVVLLPFARPGMVSLSSMPGHFLFEKMFALALSGVSARNLSYVNHYEFLCIKMNKNFLKYFS